MVRRFEVFGTKGHLATSDGGASRSNGPHLIVSTKLVFSGVLDLPKRTPPIPTVAARVRAAEADTELHVAWSRWDLKKRSSD
jgi:hypothetical protein